MAETATIAAPTFPARVINCPAEVPFLEALAKAVRSGAIFPHLELAGGAELPGIAIYLPSRRAVLPLQKEFLALARNGATLLPRIFVLGETEPLDAFAFHIRHIAKIEEAQAVLAEAIAIPPSYPSLERQLALMTDVMASANRLTSEAVVPGEPLFSSLTPAAAFKTAGEIAALFDDVLQDGVAIEKLARVDASFAAETEQLSRQLLRASLKRWSARKAQMGVIEPEERRNRLTAYEARLLSLSSAPVVIAGSTGSVAATANLMRALLKRGNGAVVLPGLDRHLDAEGWAAVQGCSEHPQNGLSRLLSFLSVDRDSVEDLRPEVYQVKIATRARFLSQAVLPASATVAWSGFFAKAKQMAGEETAPGFTLLETETGQEEAELIALILRDALADPAKTAAVVSPDRSILHRVAHALRSSGIEADGHTGAISGQLGANVLSAANTETPAALLALLRRTSMRRGREWRRHAEIVDFGCLRQMWCPRIFRDLPQALSRAALEQSRHPALQAITAADWQRTREKIETLIAAFEPLLGLKPKGRHPLKTWVAAHGETLAHLRAIGIDQEDGVRGLLSIEAGQLPSLDLDLAGFAALNAAVLAEGTPEDVPQPHPRVFLWTPRDARLRTADTVILAGLNEGVWPHRPDPGPWLGTRDRASLGMAALEQRIGQSAHDFAMLATGANRLFLTRAKKANGSLTRPSRWIARLKVVADGVGQPLQGSSDEPWLEWVRELRRPERLRPALRPQPIPPIEARPRRLSVTALETMAANPYAIYARHILKLDPIRQANEGGGPREKGILFHAAINAIFSNAGNTWPKADAAKLAAALEEAANAAGFDLRRVPFWHPRFLRFLEWFEGFEKGRRGTVVSSKSEAGAKLTIQLPKGPFDITARADRIDILNDGTAVIIDFKTSANAATNSIRRNAPQLSLEGYLASEGAFTGLSALPVSALAYIAVTGGEPPGEHLPLKGVSADLIDSAKNGMIAMLSRFDDPATPYAYEASPMFKDKADFDPYSHLARVKEWAAPGEVGDE